MMALSGWLENANEIQAAMRNKKTIRGFSIIALEMF